MIRHKGIDSTKIGERIRAQREELGLSRENFATIVNLSPYYIGQIERGDRNMSIYTLYNISEALNISIDYILKGKVQYMENILITESLKDNYKKSTDDKIKKIINLLSGSSSAHIGLITDMIKLTLPYIK